MDLISVIIPAYNAEKTIERCVNSILTNDCGNLFNYNIIIIDDGSRDNTQQIVEELAKKNDRIALISQENHGVSYSRQVGIRMAKGNFITFCDSDDYVDDDWLLMMYSAIKKYDADIATFRVIYDDIKQTFNSQDIIIWTQEEVKAEFLRHRLINGTMPTKIFKSELFKNVSFDNKLTCYEDIDIVWQILQYVQTVVRVNDARYHYTVNGDSLSNGKPNLDRIRSSHVVWQKIVEETSKSSEQIQSLARTQQVKSEICNLTQMVKYGMNEHDIVHSIHEVLKKNKPLINECKVSFLSHILLSLFLINSQLPFFCACLLRNK